MAKYGVFIRFDVEAETEEQAKTMVLDTLDMDIEANINYEVYEVEEA